MVGTCLLEHSTFSWLLDFKLVAKVNMNGPSKPLAPNAVVLWPLTWFKGVEACIKKIH